MSRIGKRIIEIPQGVEVKQDNNTITVKGPLGELSFTHKPVIKVTIADGTITTDNTNVYKRTEKEANALHGTTNSIINNNIIGVTKGYKKELKIIGVGYKAQLAGQKLTMSLGFSHPIIFEVPQEVKIELPKPTEMILSGIDKVRVGEISAQIRAFKKPEPYGGKGIRYVDEIVRRKAGKAAQK